MVCRSTRHEGALVLIGLLGSWQLGIEFSCAIEKTDDVSDSGLH